MSAPPAVRRAPPWWRWPLRGAAAGAGLLAALYAGYVLLGTNFHTVIPGAVYRTAQPSPKRLERLVRDYGIRTIVNLRGCCDPYPWYVEECVASNRLNLSQEDIPFSATRLPSVDTVRHLVEVLDRSEKPLVLHCNRGADRSGMAATMALLLQPGTTLEMARSQLGPRYGHIPLARTANMDRLFDLYEEWLTREGIEHSAEVFRRWAMQEYCPGECRCELEAIDHPPRPLHLRCAETFPFRVRCRNTSVKPWRLRPGSNTGIHVSCTIHDADGRIVRDCRGGLFDATVAPGESVDVTLAVVAPMLPGAYELRVDMVDEQNAYFMQVGSEPLCWKLEVVLP
jgi:protein tyrosine/serine phosphatase